MLGMKSFTRHATLWGFVLRGLWKKTGRWNLGSNIQVLKYEGRSEPCWLSFLFFRIYFTWVEISLYLPGVLSLGMEKSNNTICEYLKSRAASGCRLHGDRAQKFNRREKELCINICFIVCWYIIIYCWWLGKQFYSI
jgi:hypothetical protein